MDNNRVLLGVVALFTGIAVTGLNLTPRDASMISQDPWYQSVVVNSKTPIVLKFTADWCGACHHAEEHLKEVERTYGGRVRIIRVDIDKKRELADSFRVSSIPRIVMIRDGKLVSTFSSSFSRLPEWVGQNL